MEGPAAPVPAVPPAGVRKDSRNVVVAAIARELSGFVWAEMMS
jgi:hypothetical protein